MMTMIVFEHERQMMLWLLQVVCAYGRANVREVVTERQIDHIGSLVDDSKRQQTTTTTTCV
jgi:hypothetical protein